MKSLAVMLKKEWMENVRTYKVISILITCSIFGILGPLTALMMPDIMAGILPKKLQGAIPEPTYIDSYIQYFKNMNQLGLVILVFLFSSTLTQEFPKGTLINLVTKGLAKKVIILAKFIVITLLWTVSYLLSVVIHFSYTLYYFSNEGSHKLMVYGATWFIGILFISLILFFSVLFRKTLGGLLGCLFMVVLCVVSGFFKISKSYNPMLLIQKQGEILSGKFKVQDLMEPSILVFLLIIMTLLLSMYIFEKSEV